LEQICLITQETQNNLKREKSFITLGKFLETKKIFALEENYLIAFNISFDLNISLKFLFFFNIVIGIIFNKPFVLNIWFFNLPKYGIQTIKIPSNTTKNIANFILCIVKTEDRYRSNAPRYSSIKPFNIGDIAFRILTIKINIKFSM